MSLVERFPMGMRVKLSTTGLTKLGPNTRGYNPDTRGAVVGYGRMHESVRVLRDGKKTPDGYHKDFWEPETTT